MIKSIVVAVSENGIIGNKNKLLWKLRDDMKNFRNLTLGNYIIMGRKTFDSIGNPLESRINIIVTRNRNFNRPGMIIKYSIEEAIQYAEIKNQREVFIIGGGEIYRQALPFIDRLYYTKVEGNFQGDASFPEIQWDQWDMISKTEFMKNDRNDRAFQVLVLHRKQG